MRFEKHLISASRIAHDLPRVPLSTPAWVLIAVAVVSPWERKLSGWDCRFCGSHSTGPHRDHCAWVCAAHLARHYLPSDNDEAHRAIDRAARPESD